MVWKNNTVLNKKNSFSIQKINKLLDFAELV